MGRRLWLLAAAAALATGASDWRRGEGTLGVRWRLTGYATGRRGGGGELGRVRGRRVLRGELHDQDVRP